jgi:hypothetical protein
MTERKVTVGMLKAVLDTYPDDAELSLSALFSGGGMLGYRTADLDYWKPIWDDDMLTEYNT